MIKRMLAAGDRVPICPDMIQDLLVCARDCRTVRCPVPKPCAEGVRGDGQIPFGILKRAAYAYRVVDAALYLREAAICAVVIGSLSTAANLELPTGVVTRSARAL